MGTAARWLISSKNTYGLGNSAAWKLAKFHDGGLIFLLQTNFWAGPAEKAWRDLAAVDGDRWKPLKNPPAFHESEYPSDFTVSSNKQLKYVRETSARLFCCFMLYCGLEQYQFACVE
jgi:hypothetical protein